jgi:gag-polypeptide of LTR copia-type
MRDRRTRDLNTAGIPVPMIYPRSNWSGIMEAILALHEAEDLITLTAAPASHDLTEWDSLQCWTKAFLHIYIKQDVYSLIADNTALPTFKHKWDKLKNMYGGTSGSTTVFNLWIQLTQARLDDTTPMAAQLAKINETRVALANASMDVSDTQYCLILLHALPASYEVLASTILASGPATDLKHSEIIACVINEEGHWAGGSSSLNAARAAPIPYQGKWQRQS